MTGVDQKVEPVQAIVIGSLAAQFRGQNILGNAAMQGRHIRAVYMEAFLHFVLDEGLNAGQNHVHIVRLCYEMDSLEFNGDAVLQNRLGQEYAQVNPLVGCSILSSSSKDPDWK